LRQAKAGGKDGSQLNPARKFQPCAQFFLDFVEAENSTGFHAPQEAARILGKFIESCGLINGQRAILL
jgi:nitrite reductase (cytochrome c-552)